ncbi:MAG TPA: hypothetical protein VN645_02390 [Steroidobacteraceae bacterium]|nr:hypothetical protein [Steroidobacteraceae bacterium]
MMKSRLDATTNRQIGAGLARRLCLAACLVLAMTACASDQGDSTQTAVAAARPASGGCISSGGGFLQARLRGALTAELSWSNERMQCEGGPRPDGSGLRMTLAGPLPGDDARRQLRFIFGIDSKDVAAGAAQALPTNITVILEGSGQMFATRGDSHCAVETLQRAPLPAEHIERIHVRGYCTDPAAELAGDSRLLIPTFEFTGVVNTGNSP